MSEGGMNPKSLLAVLRGVLDRRVKQRGRDTIVDNAIEDPAEPLVQRVVESDACDKCKELGNSLPVDPRKVAREYHQYCKCHLALLFQKLHSFSIKVKRKVEAKALEKRVAPILAQHRVRINIVFLDEQASGTPDYSLLTRGQKKILTAEEKDAHIVFSKCGFEPTALPEDRGASANIDLLMSVTESPQYWELKSPKKGLNAQKSLTTEGVSKWSRIRNGKKPKVVDIGMLGNPKIAVDNRGNSIDDFAAAKQLVSDMEYYHLEGFDESLLIAKGGFIAHFIKR